jgi:hypothetical protein
MALGGEKPVLAMPEGAGAGDCATALGGGSDADDGGAWPDETGGGGGPTAGRAADGGAPGTSEVSESSSAEEA